MLKQGSQGAVSTNCPWFCEKWIKLFSARQSVKDKKPEARKPSTSCGRGSNTKSAGTRHQDPRHPKRPPWDVVLDMSKISPTGPTEDPWTWVSNSSIATYLGVRWDSVTFNFWSMVLGSSHAFSGGCAWEPRIAIINSHSRSFKISRLPDPDSSSWGGSKPSGACKCNASLANVVFHNLKVVPVSQNQRSFQTFVYILSPVTAVSLCEEM